MTEPNDEPSDDELMELADELGYHWPLDAQAQHDLVNAWRARVQAEESLLDPTLRPDNAQVEADEDLRAYLRRVEMGLEQIPAAPSHNKD